MVQPGKGVWVRRTLRWVRRRLPPWARAGAARDRRCSVGRNARSACRPWSQGAARHRGAGRRQQYRPTGRATAIDPSVIDILRPVFRHGGRGNRQGQMVQHRERLRLYHSGYQRRGRICSRICPRTIRVNGPQRRGSRDRRHRRGAERAGSGKGSLSVVIRAGVRFQKADRRRGASVENRSPGKPIMTVTANRTRRRPRNPNGRPRHFTLSRDLDQFN